MKYGVSRKTRVYNSKLQNTDHVVCHMFYIVHVLNNIIIIQLSLQERQDLNRLIFLMSNFFNQEIELCINIWHLHCLIHVQKN